MRDTNTHRKNLAIIAGVLVDAWQDNPRMYRVITSSRLDGVPGWADDAPARIKYAQELFGVPYIVTWKPVKAWVHIHMRSLSDALWASRPRETCIDCAVRLLGGRPTATVKVRARTLTKNHDWKTVK